MSALEHAAGRRWALTLAALVFTAVLGGQVGAGQQLAQNAAPQSATGQAEEIGGDPDAGAKVFRKCQACHSAEPGQNRVGPSLFGVVGKEAGAVEDFNYSAAMQDSDIVWTPENLDAFLTNPREFMPGTKMIVPGLRAAEDRSDLIAYLVAQAPPEEAAAEVPAADVPASEADVADPAWDVPEGAPAGYTATVRYALKTAIAGGRMVYVGVGGDIDGVINPRLTASEGSIVQVTLVNGEGAQHDFALDRPRLRSQRVTGVGASTTIAFRAGQVGETSYFCSLPGHREAGMEGVLEVTPGRPEPRQGPDISRAPTDLPEPIARREPQRVKVELESVELEGRLADGTTYQYWTFNGSVPGPFLRVRVGDTVEVSMKNDVDAAMIHSVDFHAATGPGGGAAYLQVEPGGEKKLEFKALVPGIYVYHCATPMVAHHIANGMYGLILVEPEEGLPAVDREFYVMQGEIYTTGRFGDQGMQEFSVEKMLNESPEYVVFNGNVGGLTSAHPLTASVGETVRIYFGVGGPNLTSSFHVIGEIFDRVYSLGDVISPPAQGVQTITVPAGGASIVEFGVDYPGRYILVDHALSRLERGLVGFLIAEGAADPEIYNPLSDAPDGQ
jgi:nitrite reductase (NO-forming)